MIFKFLVFSTLLLSGNNVPQSNMKKLPILTPEKVKLCSKVQDFLQPTYVANVDDRLFARQEIEYYYPISDDDLKNLTELAKIVKYVKLNLITIPIPFKGSIYLNKTNTPYTKYDPLAAQKIYLDEIKQLRNLGIPAINVDAIAREFPKGVDFFARRDHHWTGAGMEAVADQLVATIDNLKIKLDRTAQTTLTREIKPYGGSIAAELEKSCGFKFSETEQRVFYSLSIKTKEGLLEETNSDVVLTGDSFSEAYFGFDKIISDKLKTPVTNVSINGGGCCASVNGYFSELTPTSQKPKVVVWTALAVLINSRETRELKPAIYSAYLDNKVLLEKKITSNNSTNALNLKLNVGERYYVKMAFKGSKVENLKLQLDYDKGNEKIDFSRSNLVVKDDYTTTFYYEIQPKVSMLKNINLNFAGNNSVELKIYKYDKNVIK